MGNHSNTFPKKLQIFTPHLSLCVLDTFHQPHQTLKLHFLSDHWSFFIHFFMQHQTSASRVSPTSSLICTRQVACSYPACLLKTMLDLSCISVASQSPNLPCFQHLLSYHLMPFQSHQRVDDQ